MDTSIASTLVDAAGNSQINWELVRFVASNRAVTKEGTAALDWAKLALRACRLAVDGGSLTSEQGERADARVRAKLIARLGAQSGDPVRDIDELLRWFARHVDHLDLNEVWSLETSSQEHLRKGRDIKNALNALAPIATDPDLANLESLELLRAWWVKRLDLP